MYDFNFAFLTSARRIIFSTTSLRYAFLLLLFLLPFLASSQNTKGVSIYSGKSVRVHPRYAVSIFSNLTNSGSFGSEKNATVIFAGQRWINKAGSTLPDESISGVDGTGGTFKFAPAVSAAQYIDNQNSSQPGSGFPNMSIANSKDIILEGSDLAIRNNLNFETGHLVLNNRNAILGVKGSITGYDQNKYVVTGTGTSGGGLTRSISGQQQGDIVFPVGTTLSSYTPASLTYVGIPQNLKVRVFENVYEKAVFGMLENFYSVNKTWHLSISNADPKAVLNFNMQHNSIEESSQFTTSRSQSFVRRFLSQKNQYDNVPASGLTPGVITSANPISNAFVSSRVNISDLSSNEYFTKSVQKGFDLARLRVPAGISPNNDGLNDRFVIENLNPSDKVRIEIYNKEQRSVFKDPDYKNTFEAVGNQNEFVNRTLPNGAYYYIINISDGKSFRGFLIINR